jgi:hypothetical protein
MDKDFDLEFGIFVTMFELKCSYDEARQIEIGIAKENGDL